MTMRCLTVKCPTVVSVLPMTALLLLVCSQAGCSFLGGSRPTVKYIEYTVSRGDSLSYIGSKFGSSSSELAKINRIKNPNVLNVGQKLKVPYRPEVKVAVGGGVSARTGPTSGGAVADGSSLKKVQLNAARYEVGKLAWPVRGGSISSVFGRRWLSFHEGIDIPAAQGVPILAAHDGTVAYSDDGLRGYGNLIVISGSAVTTIYSHNRRNYVKRGQRVKRGQKIGEVGMTGKASGPHLHFETRIKDSRGKLVAVDPLVFYPK